MKTRFGWLAIAAVGTLASACAQSGAPRILCERYLDLLLKNPIFGVEVFVHDFPSAMTADDVLHVKSLEESGDHEDARAKLLSIIKTAALSHTNAAAYVAEERDVESRCESDQGDGYWQGSLLVSLRDFCDGAANVAVLVREKSDHPAEF